ncbi:MAG: histidine triad nucleotide-binding protein [Clostridia bacterium]|nr:histidine triad nucleotide-binding protein [Clostridia bacterium]
MENCIFCKIAAGEIPAAVVYEDEDALAFKDVNPQAPVHVLLVPKKHVRDVLDCAENAPELLGKLSVLTAKVARDQGLSENGFRLVSNCGEDARQSVKHFHIHILGGKTMADGMV